MVPSGKHSSVNPNRRSILPLLPLRAEGDKPELSLTHRQKFPSELKPNRKEALSIVSSGSERTLAAAARRNHRRYREGDGSPRRRNLAFSAPGDSPITSLKRPREEYREGNSNTLRQKPLRSSGRPRPSLWVKSAKSPSTQGEDLAVC